MSYPPSKQNFVENKENFCLFDFYPTTKPIVVVVVVFEADPIVVDVIFEEAMVVDNMVVVVLFEVCVRIL